jgi:hypothetical protein
MKTTFLITMEAVLPVIAKIYVEAVTEADAATLALRIADCQRTGVKTAAFQIENYPSDFLTVEAMSEIMAVDPAEVGKVWNRDEIEELLQ